MIRLGARPSAIASSPNVSDDAAISRTRSQPDASVATRNPPSDHADAEAHLEDREVHDVALLARRERPHQHQRHEVRRGDREHEDDPEQHEHPAHERVIADVPDRLRRGPRSTPVAASAPAAGSSRPGSSTAGAIPIAAVTTSMNRIGTIASGERVARGVRGVDQPGRGRRDERHGRLDRAQEPVHADELVGRRDLRDQRGDRRHLDARAGRPDREHHEDQPRLGEAGEHDRGEAQRREPRSPRRRR